MKEATLKWLNKASEDLRGAKILLKHEEAPTNIIGFLCQQCVEKSFKGFLEEHNVTFPRTHDLVLLVELCGKISDEFEILEQEVDIFEPFAVESRYEDNDLLYPNMEEVRSFFETTERIFNFVWDKIER